jgi:hypothetical protein
MPISTNGGDVSVRLQNHAAAPAERASASKPAADTNTTFDQKNGPATFLSERFRMERKPQDQAAAQ